MLGAWMKPAQKARSSNISKIRFEVQNFALQQQTKNQMDNFTYSLSLAPRPPPQPLPAPTRQIYQKKYILNAISYSLAVGLNRYHSRAKTNSQRPDNACEMTLDLKKPEGNFSCVSRNIKYGIITLDDRQQKQQECAFKNNDFWLKKTQEEEKPVSFQLFKKITAGQTPLPRKTLSSTSISVQTLKQPKAKTQQQECSLFYEIQVNLCRQAELPSLKLENRDLLDKKERLLLRKVNGWTEKAPKKKVKREIKSLMH